MLCATLAAGCSGKPATVSGVVTLDGAPVESGMVIFQPASGGASAYGVIGAGGAYTLRTGASEGLQPGEYVVMVSSTSETTDELEKNDRGEMQEKMPVLLTPAQYADPTTTPLREEVQSGANTINLQLTKS